MKLEGNVGQFELDKRTYLPGAALVGVCPGCGAAYRRDFTHQYMNGTANAVQNETCYCNQCGHAWPVKLMVNVSLSLIPDSTEQDLEPTG